MSDDRTDRLSEIRAAARRDREDRDLAREIGTRRAQNDVPIARDAPARRCRHSTKPGPCSICMRPEVRRLAPGQSGGVDRKSVIPAHVPRQNARQRARIRARAENTTPFAAGDRQGSPHAVEAETPPVAGGDLSPGTGEPEAAS